MTTVPQLRALRWYAAQLALSTVGLRLSPCGCVYERITAPIGGITEAYVIRTRCDAHKGET